MTEQQFYDILHRVLASIEVTQKEILDNQKRILYSNLCSSISSGSDIVDLEELHDLKRKIRNEIANS